MARKTHREVINNLIRGPFKLRGDNMSHWPVVKAKRVLKTATGPEVQEEARKGALDSVRALRAIVNSKTASDVARISAAQTLFDRGYGKPMQTNINATVNTDGKPSEINEQELNRRVAETITRIEALTKRKREKIKVEERPVDIRLLN